VFKEDAVKFGTQDYDIRDFVRLCWVTTRVTENTRRKILHEHSPIVCNDRVLLTLLGENWGSPKDNLVLAETDWGFMKTMPDWSRRDWFDYIADHYQEELQ